MTVFSLTVGLVVRRGNRTYQLERELEDGTLVFQDRVSGRPWSTTRAALWRELDKGDLSVVLGDTPDAAKPPDAPSNLLFTWTSSPEKWRKEIERRLEYIKAARRKGLTRGMRTAMEEVIKEVAKKRGDVSPPSESTLMAWMRKFDLGGGTPASQLSGYANRKQSKRTSLKLLAFCREGLRTFYCTRKRPSLRDTQVFIEKGIPAAVKQGRLDPADGTPTYSLLQRLKGEIDPYVLDVKRYGAAYANNRWRYSKSGAGCTRALQRYEVDHTVLDIVVICDKTGMPLGRPTLTVVVDAYSGYVVGFFISFWGTGLAATFCGLRVAIAPKEDLRSVIKGLEHEWLGMGLPEELVLDNGLEFHSPQFRQMALQLSIDLQYCAVRQPWLKPFVERALGKILGYLPAAGRVRKGLTNELPLDPAETAAVTFGDLVRGLLIAFLDVHPFEINQRRLSRPYDLFAESLELLPPATLPMGTKELEIIVAPSDVRTVGNEGIVTEYLRFNSDELQALRRKTGHTFKTTTKPNPENLEYIWVQDPTSKGWLMVPSCQPEYTRGLSIVQHRAIRSFKKAELSRKGADETLMRGKVELMEMWNSRTIHGRRLKSAHLRALSGFTSSHALRFDDDEASPPAQDSKRIVTPEEMAPSPRDIPAFEGFAM
ncbi:transposase family protein [Piscinibacter gummiphilus]|uniref:Transposase family protein n=1 Tax=Piscinibacter gummiphilus TaxID=946333 RepID=A0ABZ0D2K8_9BURK|nr:transposase family protein [Piscinibacter gummiphilus]WOB11402.1 transposase family protein [Piscinibacter gummiphilus]